MERQKDKAYTMLFRHGRENRKRILFSYEICYNAQVY